ncbi:MAG: tripartite tricarboxylate transporter substrate binding protein [Betaproteobacteria bacterium]|nr:tripartite tricarboxylate transporter substrate binding protein [Betaproteobacteria bacterium]
MITATRDGLRWLLWALAAAAAAWLPQVAAAQEYPTRPVKYVVPFPPGGLTDVMARNVGQKLAERWKQPVIVENRAGGNAQIGADVVAKSPGDGYTLLAVTLTHAVNVTLFPAAPYSLQKDLTPVAVLGSLPLMIVVPAASPIRSMSDLVAAGKARMLNGGSSGNGPPPHLGLELLAQQAGIKVQHIPYKGGTPSLTDLMGGQIDLIVSNFPESLPHVKGGKLRALAVTSRQRHPLLPDVPTTAEVGYPQLSITNWTGVMVPAATPAAIVARINADANAALAEPEMKKRIIDQGFEPVAMTPAEARAFFDTEAARWGKLVREAGIKPD